VSVKPQEVKLCHTVGEGSTAGPENENIQPRGCILDTVTVVPSTITIVRKHLGENL